MNMLCCTEIPRWLKQMIEIDSDFPFLWRLGAETSEGRCAVSLVVPYQTEDDSRDLTQDLTIETSIHSLSMGRMDKEAEEVLEWNNDDINLFVRMVNQQRHSQNLPVSDTLRIDLSDPSIVEIINVVAAAGFGTPYSSCGVLQESASDYPAYQCYIGGSASLNTVDGFKSCVVVAIEDDDVICVLLDDVILSATDETKNLHRHDLVLVKTSDVLHPEFAVVDLDAGPASTH